MSDTLRELIAKWREQWRPQFRSDKRMSAYDLGRSVAKGECADELSVAVAEWESVSALATLATPLVSPPGERTPPTCATCGHETHTRGQCWTIVSTFDGVQICQCEAPPSAPPPAETRKGPKCINCGVDDDGGYATEDIGPFCSLCWGAVLEAGKASEAPPETPRELCGAEYRPSLGTPLYCTLQRGHLGLHVAQVGPDGPTLATWAGVSVISTTVETPREEPR